MKKQEQESFVDFLDKFSDNGTDVFLVYEIKSNKIIHVSQSYEQVYGKSCIGLLLDPDSFRDATHPEDASIVERHIYELKKGNSSEVEYRIIHPSTEIRWIFSRIIPFHIRGKHAWSVISSKDITKNKKTNNNIYESEYILKVILDKSSDFIILFDVNKKILLTNKTVSKFFEMEQTDLVGTHISHLLPAELHDIMDFHYTKVVKSRSPEVFRSYTGGKLNHYLHPIMNASNEVLCVLYCIQGSPEHPFSNSRYEMGNKPESNYPGVEIDLIYQAFKFLLTNKNYDQFSALKKIMEAKADTGSGPKSRVNCSLEQILSSRELEIASLIKEGKTNKEIAQILNLSVRTIEAHRYKMRDKVGLKNKRKTSLRNQLFFIHESCES